MKRSWYVSVVAVVQFTAATLCMAKPPPPGHPIVGTWHVYAADTECVETWEIRADGTTHNFSGSEESFSVYEVSAAPTEHGYYILTDTITKTNGQPDCGGSATPVGDRATNFLVPLSGDRFKMCIDPFLTHCPGILTRASKPASVSNHVDPASDVSATVTIFHKQDTCAIELAGRSPSKFDVSCSEVALTLFQLSVPKGSAVFIRVLGAITKDKSAALHKQIEDAGYVIQTIKVGFLTEPPHPDR